MYLKGGRRVNPKIEHMINWHKAIPQVLPISLQ